MVPVGRRSPYRELYLAKPAGQPWYRNLHRRLRVEQPRNTQERRNTDSTIEGPMSEPACGRMRRTEEPHLVTPTLAMRAFFTPMSLRGATSLLRS